MFKKWIIVPLLFLLSGGGVNAEEKVNNYQVVLGSTPSFKADGGGLYLGYCTKQDNTLYIKRVDKDLDKETAVTEEDRKGRFNLLSFLKDGMVLTWRPKASDGKKYVYVQRSEDGGKTFKAPVVVNSTTDALTPIATADDGKDRFYVFWLDERSGRYEIYMNYSTDGARSFLAKDIPLTSDFFGVGLPEAVIKGERIDFFFHGREKKEVDNLGMYHRYSLDGGKTWSKVDMIEENMGWSPFTIKALWSGDNLMVFWAGLKGLHCARSRDGKTWEKVDFKDTEGMDVSRLELKAGGNKAYIATSWKPKSEREIKPDVYFYKSEDGGITWSGPRKLNRNPYNTTSSTYPDIALGKDGTILVAWQDHRYIRGSIFINYSKDGGETWLDNDIPLEKEPSRFNDSLPYVENFMDRFYVLWYRFTSDSRDEADLYMEEAVIK